MFSKNNQISEHQEFTLFLCSMLPIYTTFVPHYVAYWREGWGFFLVTMAISYGIFCAAWYLSERWRGDFDRHPWMRAFFSVLAIIKWFIMLAFFWKELIPMMKERLLSNQSILWGIILLVLVSIWLAMAGIEVRGRVSECVSIILLAFVVLVLIGGWRNGEISLLRTMPVLGSKNGMWHFLLFVFFFVPVECLFLRKNKGKKMLLWGGVFTACSIVIMILLVYVLGYHSLRMEAAPIITLTGFYSLFGSSVFRHDSIFFCILLIGFFLGSGSLVWHIIEASNNLKIKSSVTVVVLVSLFMTLFGRSFFHSFAADKEPMRELEENAYVLALGIDYKEPYFQMIFTFAGDKTNEQHVTIEVEELAKGEQIYEMESDRGLSYAQMQVILLGEACFDEEIMKKVLDFFSKTRVFSSNTMCLKGVPSAYEVLSSKQQEEIGLAVKNFVKKQGVTGHTVGTMTNLYRNHIRQKQLLGIEVVEQGFRIVH